MDLSALDTLLVPPSNVRFVAARDLTRPVSEDDAFGYFEADTRNGLAAYPNDFDIVGGPDAGMFVRGSSYGVSWMTAARRSVIRPSRALIAVANTVFLTDQLPKKVTYRVQVIARDKWGNVSAPTDITIPVTFALAPPAPQSPPPPAAPAPDSLTPTQVLAREIATTLDPERTPVWFDAYHKAMRVPQDCGVAESNGEFLAVYRAAYERTRTRLTINNFQGFATTLCNSWRSARNADQNDIDAADAAWRETLSKHRVRIAQHETDVLQAEIEQKSVLMVVGSAMGVFLSLSLFLAFLAMEGHSRAIREALQALASPERRGQG